MKLNSDQVTRTLSQFDAQVLPDNHPAIPQLNSMFGDHTFFLNSTGLNVLEATSAAEREAEAGQIVNIAFWSDDTQTSLKVHEPEPTGVVISLANMH
jgi:hypothetical protein